MQLWRTRASRVRAEATEPVVSKCGFCWCSGKEPRGGTLGGVLGKHSTTSPLLKKIARHLISSFIHSTNTLRFCASGIGFAPKDPNLGAGSDYRGREIVTSSRQVKAESESQVGG